MSEAGHQLPLPFVHRPDYADTDFIAAPSNEEARAWLGRSAEWPAGRLALWGEEGCGKTHLLRVWARRHGASVLSGDAVPDTPPGGPVAIDAADAALADEARLLHCLNAASEAGHPVLLAARTPPARWPASLPDLASRVRAVVAVRIAPAEDELLDALLARLLATRQLAVPASVQSWLRLRLPRTPAALHEAAERLDAAGLAAQRPVTRATATAVLSSLEV